VTGLRLEAVELHRVSMPLVRPFRTSFGTQTVRDVVLVRVVTDVAEGWGELVTTAAPVYSSEFTDGAVQVLRDHLVPRLPRTSLTARRLHEALAGVRGHRMAVAALEMAVLDAELRATERSFAEAFGGVRDRVDCGVSVGIPDGGVPALVDEVTGYLDDGYRRIKLKIEPGFDLEPVAAVRAAHPEVALQVDANAAYTLDDAEHLAGLDDHDLELVEQPLGEEHLLDHTRLAERLATPVCLDETIVSPAVARDALDLGACTIVNIKPGRVGGLLPSVAIHDLCRDRDVPVWCGGMLETGVGRAANVALASLPGFTLPGDTSASDRYYATDVTAPFVLDDGRLEVPRSPGLTRHPEPAILAELRTGLESLPLPS
jgi:o-succinylbenzoate synthase